MTTVTNRAAGPRIVWTKGENGQPAARVLQVGESADLDLFTTEEPVFKAWVKTGEIVLGDQPAPGDGDGDGETDEELSTLSDDELRAYLTDRGVTPGARWGTPRLLAEATKLKAAGTQG